MNDYVIMTDSCADLPIEFIQKNQVPYVSLNYGYNGNEYKDDFGCSQSFQTFFNDMRKGAMPLTSQPNSEAFYKAFKENIIHGRDILFISISSALSGSINSANLAKNSIQEEYPEAKIYIIDSLMATFGEGYLVYLAYELKKTGKTIEENVRYLEENKQKVNGYFMVDDLIYLKKGGRISNTAAYLGFVLHVKPVLVINHEGKVVPVFKAKGRKNGIEKIAALVKKRIENPEKQILCIGHCDCIQDAVYLKDLILRDVKFKNVIINDAGPVIGTYAGPDTIAAFFLGRERQFA